MSLQVSVVVPAYNRIDLVERLLADLTRQTLPADAFEVLVVDDGSVPPVEPQVAGVEVCYGLTVLRQDNAGPAAARHRGVLAAQGRVIVFVDDDMEVAPSFLQAHIRAHENGCTLVQGRICPSPNLQKMPLYERFHARQLERFVRALQAGTAAMQGVDVCTGNLSVDREAYLRVGGFDASLGRSEDRDLGVRFEEAGERLAFCYDASSLHCSDHASLEVWLRRAFHYGVFDHRIAKKNPGSVVADPWRFWFLVSPLSRPLIAASVAVPSFGRVLSPWVMRTAEVVDASGLERLAMAGTTLAYGLEYFRGVREETGSLPSTMHDHLSYRRRRRASGSMAKEGGMGRELGGALRRFVRNVVADYDAVRAYRRKYNEDEVPAHRLPIDAVRKIGVQMMVAVRLMRLLKEGRIPLGAQVASRFIRHLYGADVHWDAELAPGVSLIHGLGLVVSHGARVGEGCILFHNVTLGEGIDPKTRTVGSPTLERNVHVGPGCTLVGPITVGEGSKLMAGVVLAESVPPRSLVTPSEARIASRDQKRSGRGTR